MKRGFTLLETLVVIVVIVALAALLLPVLSSARVSARRTSCANNLHALGCALTMYSDVPSFACFPVFRSNGRAEPLPSLGILYRDYVVDYRVFSCPGIPTVQALRRMEPTIAGAKSSLPLDASMTHYAYDSGNKATGYKPHTTKDAMAILVADFSEAGRNADNHGERAGQNCLRVSGSVEWSESLSNTVASGSPPVVDVDITADGTLDDPKWENMKSYISQ